MSLWVLVWGRMGEGGAGKAGPKVALQSGVCEIDQRHCLSWGLTWARWRHSRTGVPHRRPLCSWRTSFIPVLTDSLLRPRELSSPPPRGLCVHPGDPLDSTSSLTVALDPSAWASSGMWLVSACKMGHGGVPASHPFTVLLTVGPPTKPFGRPILSKLELGCRPPITPSAHLGEVGLPALS